MKAFFALLTAVLATAVTGQSVSAVTVTAEPAPSAPSGAEPPPFSVSIVSAPAPEPPAPQSSTVFVSANPAPVPTPSVSPLVPAPEPPAPQSSTVFVSANPAPVPTPSVSPLVPSPMPSPSVPAPSPPSPSGGGGGPSTGGICGLGYTYCGYILRDHQGYPESDVIKAYCAGSADNCAGGTPKSDPIQALYICLPPTSPKVRGRQAPQPSGLGGSGGQSPTGCAAPQAGNKLELICSCGGQCLNPEADHIGRCDKPCV